MRPSEGCLADARLSQPMALARANVRCMTFTPTSLRLIATAAGAVCLAGCAQRPTVTAQTVGMANPASVYCVEQGGKLHILSSATGDQGICRLPDGQEIEEWALFRRDHR